MGLRGVDTHVNDFPKGIAVGHGVPRGADPQAGHEQHQKKHGGSLGHGVVWVVNGAIELSWARQMSVP
jgi:hypothetical protein